MAAINGQHESKESFYHLEICCRYVGEKYGQAAIAEWTNGDYIRLSSILSHHTGTQISPNTLKRIFGKLKTPERYYPQKATRDALARYAGYQDWENFLLQHPRMPKQEEKLIVQQNQLPAAPQTAPSTAPRSAGKSKWWGLAALLTMVAVLVVWWQWPAGKAIADIRPGDATLVCNNPEGENPHSAVFKLVLPPHFAGNKDSFYLHFGDSRPARRILPGFLITHYYEVPGRYYARLMYNKKDIDTVAIYLKTNGWTATGTMDRDTVRVYPVNTGFLFKNGSLQVNTQQLLQAGIDTNKTFYVEFVNTRPTHIDGDNFELTAGLTTSPLRAGVRCSQVTTTVYGENAAHAFRIIKPGCTTFTNLRFSELYKEGEMDDLSALGVDLTHGGTIRLKVVNKQVTLWVNDKAVYSVGYQQPLGKVYGVRISFAGIGVIKSVQLKDLASGEIFNDGFFSTF